MTLPKPTTRAERRRWQEQDEADARRQMTARPNIPYRPDPHYDECGQSKYATHRFVVSPSQRRLVCEFCGRPESECRKGSR